MFWYGEGIQTTASIVRTLGHLVLYLNGHHQADDTPSMVDVHRQIGHLPMKRPFRLDADRIRRKLQDPETRAVYEALGTPTIESLLRLYTGGPTEARRFVGEAPVLTDDRPRLEYFLSLDPPQPLDITQLRGDVRAILSGSGSN